MIVKQQIPSAEATTHGATHDREPSGPVLGPAHEGTGAPEVFDEQSSASRTVVHDLTLPPVPNLDIPPSPPGSPSPSANAKFAHFLTLKKQDVHFNEKLAGSVSLKNPSLLRKMMEHAGIDHQAQYFSSLPPELWSTTDLPNWGYKEELLKAQRELNTRAEEGRLQGQRDTIEFVSDSTRSGAAFLTQSRQR